MLLLPVVASLAFTDKNARRQVAAQITTVLMMGCLLLTYGRSAWIGAVVGLAALVVLSSRVAERKEKSSLSLAARKHQMVLPGMLAVATLGFVLLMSFQNRDVASRASTLTSLATDASWQGRLQSHWAGAWQMVQERPITGLGRRAVPAVPETVHASGGDIAPGGLGTRVSLTRTRTRSTCRQLRSLASLAWL
jgi:O-antigen ligase